MGVSACSRGLQLSVNFGERGFSFAPPDTQFGQMAPAPAPAVAEKAAAPAAVGEIAALLASLDLAQYAPAFVFEGLQPGEPGAKYTGVFELTDQTANGRPVWQAAGGKDEYAFFASDGKWWICIGADTMRAGKAAGVVSSVAAEPGALTPDQVQGGWQVSDGTAWFAAPGLRVRPATAAERAAREEAAARQAGEAAGDLVFEGLQPGEPGAGRMGVFELTDQTANGRPVWQAAGGKDEYAFVGSTGRWFIGDGENMRTGQAAGLVMSVAAEPGALTPDQVQGGWQALDGKGGWVAAPGLRVRPWTAADKAAAAERAAREEAAASQLEAVARQTSCQVQLQVCEGCEVTVDGSFVEGVSRFPSVVAPAVSLTSGKWWYEATVIRLGECPQIGWADDAFTVRADHGVGDDAHSWAVDGVRVKVWHGGEGAVYGSAWRAGDVVGFAVDLDAGTISFSLNGIWEPPMGEAFAGIAVQGGLRPAFTLGCVQSLA
jgi:hypothetical protein